VPTSRRGRPSTSRPRCKGETITLAGEDGKPFKVKIPAGVADGQKIRLRGRGRPSPDGGSPATSSCR
jgi:molecular chaperone DnaJ